MTARPKWDYCMKELFRNLWRRYKYQKQGIVDVLLDLNKALTGQRMDEWIQLFNVETVDDLKMLETMTKNPGIRTGNVKKI